ncbi:hypothetical protein POTOM_054928 [Populus tomentosa]|uniref:COP9 signalosome complex subunit 3 n=1 Tax=Populus tomentosa TaxID=118781 RepID=A0A8X8BYU3_POPTO|nr:hypothetical protein POTOM_054928 [Populus tomentosa]
MGGKRHALLGRLPVSKREDWFSSFAVIAVSKRFKDQVLILEVPMRGVAPLLEAVKKLRSSSEHLTALRPDFLQLCLLAKCYKTGLSILEDDIFEVDQPWDFFFYCYYGLAVASRIDRHLFCMIGRIPFRTLLKSIKPVKAKVKETLLVAREGRVWCLEDRLVLGGFDWDPTLQEKACGQGDLLIESACLWTSGGIPKHCGTDLLSPGPSAFWLLLLLLLLLLLDIHELYFSLNCRYTLRNAEYRLCLERNLDIHEEDSEKQAQGNSKNNLQGLVLESEETNQSLGKDTEFEKIAEDLSDDINIQGLGEISLEAQQYILHLQSHLSSVKKELHEVRMKSAALQMQQFVGEEKNDLLDYLRSLQPEKDYNEDGKLSFSEFFDLIKAFGNQVADNNILDLELFHLFTRKRSFLKLPTRMGMMLEPLINCCPVCGEILEVSDKLNTLVHLSLCFDEGTGNQVMTCGFLTDKQASYGWMFKLSEWAHFSSYDVGLNSGSSASHILVVTAPMSSINAIAVEAFKKYILVSLIQNSQFSTSLPKYTSSAAQRDLKTLCQVITTCKLYDNNLGLVKQVISSMYKRNIQRLTQTYLTLSLQDIVKIVQLSSPKEAEMHVLQMVVSCAIILDSKMVRYMQQSTKKMGWIMTLSNKLNAVDELLSCDPLYLAKAGREHKRFDFDDFDPVSQKFNI